ncbi:unnamed protein product [Prorocentrum cordatum]|uniref:Magnesium transporter n=1 Tax=Prorocentrum cordatum TaxID=2364126 RepID=A0ABN9P919_9DINO|nr:unnamed protein product [Polarella glacialis]
MALSVAPLPLAPPARGGSRRRRRRRPDAALLGVLSAAAAAVAAACGRGLAPGGGRAFAAPAALAASGEARGRSTAAPRGRRRPQGARRACPRGRRWASRAPRPGRGAHVLLPPAAAAPEVDPGVAADEEDERKFREQLPNIILSIASVVTVGSLGTIAVQGSEIEFFVPAAMFATLGGGVALAVSGLMAVSGGGKKKKGGQ